MMMMMMMNCFCGMADRRKTKPSFQPGPSSEILTIVNLRHVTSRILQKFSGKHLCRVSVLINLQVSGLQLKKRLWQKCFPVNFVKFLKNTFFTENFQVTASATEYS